MSKKHELTRLQPMTAGADLTDKVGYAVERSGANVIVATDKTVAGGKRCAGIVNEGTASGGRSSICTFGPAWGRAGGVLTRGTHYFLTFDSANGKLIAASPGDQIVAYWDDDGSDAAAADGDVIPIFVLPTQYVDGVAASDFRRPSLSLGAEAANVRKLSVQIKDLGGNDVAAAHTIHVRLYAGTMIESLAAAFTLADGGAGSVVSTTANAALLYSTDATGLAEINITDANPPANTTIYVEVIVESQGNYAGLASYIACAFDNNA